MTKQNTHKRQTSTTPVGLEPVVPAIGRRPAP